MKKVISFSLWGNNPKYTLGAIENVLLAKKYYHDWICRFYYSEDVPIEVLKALEGLNVELIPRQSVTNSLGLFWRFEVAYDKDVDYFIVRDTDSRLNIRESVSVQEWLQSNKPLHIMRDHKYHNVPILGGMWGAKVGFISNFQKLQEDYVSNIKNNLNCFDQDQIFLRVAILPHISINDIYCNDDVYKLFGIEKPFTKKLQESYFVGQTYNNNQQPVFNYD